MEEFEECPVCNEKSVICDEENGQKVKVCTECGAMDADMQDLANEKTLEATAEAHKKCDPVLTAAMRSCFWMAKEDIPLSKYSSVIMLQKLNGCIELDNLEVWKNATYSSKATGKELMECIAETIHKTKMNKGTTLTDGITRGPDALRFKSGLQTECWGLKAGRKMIRTLGPSFSFSKDMIEDAVKLYERAFHEDVKFLQEGRRHGMCAACLYVVSKINNSGIEIRTLLKHLNARHPFRIFSNALNILKTKYGITLPRNSFSEDCHHFLKERSFNLEEIRLVQQLLPLLRRSWISEGRLSRNFIHAASYFAWKAKDYPNRRKMGYLKFSEVFGLVKNNARKKEIESLLRAMIKELPWINKNVEKIDVALHLYDVVKYQHLLFDSALQTTLANLKQEETVEIKEESLEFDVDTIEEHESVFVKYGRKRNLDEPSDDLVDLESLPKRSRITDERDKKYPAAADDDDLDLGSDDDTNQYIRTEYEVKEIEALYASNQSD